MELRFDDSITSKDFNLDTCSTLPLFDHLYEAPTVFCPEDIVDVVRQQRGLTVSGLPSVCILDFDGDLTDAMVHEERVRLVPEWACFHTSMWSLEIDGQQCGIIPRTIGGPYAVMVAEQLLVSGVRVVVGLTSAGRVGSPLPIPSIVIADRAIRDEGTSYHYLPPSDVVSTSEQIINALEQYCSCLTLPVQRGLVWTTDAPYRETAEQTERYAAMGALAVEMQAASLFAFAEARGAVVGLVAHITNDVTYANRERETFDKGNHNLQVALLEAICRGALSVKG